MGPDTLSRNGDKYQSTLRNISQELRQEMETKHYAFNGIKDIVDSDCF